jgi:ribosomal protein L29
MRPLPDLRELSRDELEREIDALEEAVLEAGQVGGL